MNAAAGDFAPTVLMPGDPLRAEYIANNYLEGAKRVTDVRNMWGFTGEYQGIPVSVMAHGMGIPSVSIYVTELVTEYDVKRVIRVGSCGTSHPDVRLRDILIAQGASTDSGVNRMRFGGYDLAALATFSLVQNAVQAAEALGVRHHVGNIFSADLFYIARSGHVRDDGEIQRAGHRDGGLPASSRSRPNTVWSRSRYARSATTSRQARRLRPTNGRRHSTK